MMIERSGFLLIAGALAAGGAGGWLAHDAKTERDRGDHALETPPSPSPVATIAPTPEPKVAPVEQ